MDAKPEKKVCRTDSEIGSLIKAHRQCHTAAEWVAIDRGSGEAARGFVERNTAPGFKPN